MSDVFVTTCGTMRNIAPMNGKDYTLCELQSYVGGLVETVRLGEKVLVVDEEGKLKGKPVNRIATGWLQTSGIADYIVGDAMLIDRTHIK